MKTLILVRHGDFICSNPFVPDIGCSLSRKGKRDVGEAVGRIAGLQLHPDLILSSPARRTGKTAEIFGKKLGVPAGQIKVESKLFEAEKREIIRIVHELDDSLNTVMLVGHNPAMSELLHHLVQSDVYHMKQAACAVLEIKTDRWRDAAFGKAELMHLDVSEDKPQILGWRVRFEFWRRSRIQKIEQFVIFLIGLLIILGVIIWAVWLSADSVGLPPHGR